MNKNLIIVGMGGHGKSVADVAVQMKRWETISFLDEFYESSGEKLPFGFELLRGDLSLLDSREDTDVFVAFGNNEKRREIQEALMLKNLDIPVLIHPRSVVSEEAEIGEGTVVMAGAVINCFTKIGRGCIVNTSATVDHDSVLEDYVHISPGANLGGGVRVGENTWIGLGSSVIQSVSVSPNTIVGAGGVVIKDIESPGVYAGVPVKNLHG